MSGRAPLPGLRARGARRDTSLPEVKLWICPETWLSRVSYYMSGFIELQARHEVRLRLVGGVLKWALRARSMPDPSGLFGFHLLGELAVRGAPPRRFAIDTTDSRTQLHRGVLEAAHRVYKVNYSPAAAEGALPASLAGKLTAIDAFFPVALPAHADLVLKWGVNPVSARLLRRRSIRALSRRPALADLRAFRGAPKRRDVFANLTAWPHNIEERCALISRLKQMDIDFHGGFQPNELALRCCPENTLQSPLSTPAYFAALAEARVTLVVPGCHDCIPAKLPEQMAMGATILVVPSENEQDTPLRDGVDVVYAGSDLDDVEDQVYRLLADEEQRRALGASAARRFDTCLQPVAVARRLVAGMGEGKAT